MHMHRQHGAMRERERERGAAALPLVLHRPQLIPPAPNPRALAFLPDLGGLPWIACGAHSLLVISHLPSPPTSHNTSTNTNTNSSPFFQQVIDLRSPVAAAAWCRGELAAAAANSVSVFQPAPALSPGPFSWHLRWTISETFAVSAVAWTGSGDGIVLVGVEVALWARVESSSWQLAWRSTLQVPQSLVSTTHFVQGPIATSAASPTEDRTPVLVYLNDAKLGVMKAELVHPRPVSKIQWRPWPSSVSDVSDVRREVLMTCCLDGTVRLWSENEVVVSKKHRDMQRSFSVIAVIEMNNTLKGALGVDVSVRWAVENGGVVLRGGGGKFELFSGDSGQNQVGNCEWLISVGPGPCVNFWAVHCLDDVSPPRYPRITLWKESKLLGWGEFGVNTGSQKSIEQPILVEAIISRRICSGPPNTCSLLHLLPDNSFIWYRLSSNPSSDAGSQISSDAINNTSCCSTRTINQYGHEGSIRQVSIHRISCEIELAVSMDSTGMLFFWSLSTFSTFMPSLHAPTYPLWKLLCKFDLRGISTDVQYSCLCWAPSVIHNNRFLILGGENGADCFIVGISGGEVISCNKMFTINFLGMSNTEGPPDSIHATPLASNCNEPFVNNSFLVFCIWRKSFQALSWKVILHSENQYGGGCLCAFATSSVSTADKGRHVSYFKGELFSAAIYAGSSVFPSGLVKECPTCISVMTLNNTVLPIQQHGSSRIAPGYHIATGCSNGTVKLWRMSCADSSSQTETNSLNWELVGMFGAHQGPVSAVSLSICGRVATVSINVQTNCTSLHVWEVVNLMGDGSFLLEDALVLHGPVVGLDWLSLSDGQFLLGTYLPNELRIYSHKRPSNQNVLATENSKEKHIWSCIALAHSHHDIEDFLWGPKVTIVLVHKKHLSLFSPWLVRTGEADEYITQKYASSAVDMHEELPCARHFNETIFDKFRSSENFSNTDTGDNSSVLLPNQHDNSDSVTGLWNLLDVADKLGGSLASYHPRALIQYLYSGNWRRANAVLQHLVQSIKVSETSKIMSECSSCSKSFHTIPEFPLSEYFMDTTSNNTSSKGLLWGDSRSSTAFSLLSPPNSFSYMEGNLGINSSAALSQRSEIIQLLDKNVDVSTISGIERTQILAIADLLDEITDQSCASPYKSLDEAGRRFWVAVQFQHAYALRRFGDSSSAEGCHIDSAFIAWAFQSDCQDDLLNSVLPAESTWSAMQNLGIGLWYSNVPQIRTRMEKLARLQYLKNKDPKECALLYIALNRIQVLVGLFKISRDEKDKRLYEFLSRNFQKEKHKAAALKNAYVLMGRHQWELAIGFFLLGGDTSSAVNVCAKNLRDEQLALVICRLVEGSGGSLERNLISNVLLPGAVEKGDYWLSSLLEWMLGNYSQSVEKLFDYHIKSLLDESSTRYNQYVFADPEVGQYCAMLATKNSFRNSMGEALSARLSKLSFAVAASALSGCGLPLEALECLSCNSSIDGKDGSSSLHTGDYKIFDRILSPFSTSCSNWLSSSVVTNIELNCKVTMASKYLSRLLRGHPPCSQCSLPSTRDKLIIKEYNDHQIGELVLIVKTTISIFGTRFSLKFADLAEKILSMSYNDGLLFLAYVLLWGNRSPDTESDGVGLEVCALRPIGCLLLKACQETCSFLAQYVVSFCFIYFVQNMAYNTSACAHKDNQRYILSSLSSFLRISRLLLKHQNEGTSAIDNTSAVLAVLDILEYDIEFAFSWILQDVKALIIMINPVLDASINGESFQMVLHRLMQALHHKRNIMSSNTVEVVSNGSCHERQPEKGEDPSLSIDEKWRLVGAFLWIRLSSFMKHYLTEFIEKERLEHGNSASDVEFKGFICSDATRFIMESLDFVSSSLVKLNAAFFREKLMKNLHSSAPFWLEYKSSQPRSINNSHDQRSSIFQLPINENMGVFNILWEISASPLDICTAFVNEEVNCFPLSSLNLTNSWKDVVRGTAVEYEGNVTQSSGEENKYNVSSKNNEIGQGFISRASSNVESSLEPKRKGLIVHKDGYFQSPRELLRRNGELLEAICPNSINEQQVAVATNRKGLIFFNWNGKQHNNTLAEYVWSKSDWPLDGWAGSESTPPPTFVSPGVDLGSKRGTQLGLDGATIGLGSLAKPGRDLTGGGAFGIPGYAGIGASGFGWGEPEEFEEFVDPPATLENIHSRALSRHPSLPLLLVGSSNTHVYLWEFGKDSAVATYGVLPPANIPPPYALASVSAVQFDYYGQRFATSALDGTVCTWQLEVGGRSNVHPTESSLCFNSHASDVAYVGKSGSVIAAAGCSSNGANVVIWDTLAPPTTCQASIMCHEGGARSLAVFDNDVGCASISPLVVTGGKNGDVSLHDFRFVATGSDKHHKSSNEQGIKGSSKNGTKSGTSNDASTVGMIWHIPKAHLGSVTTVSTIPNTSLFLTGGKDGDVKLWDAKNSQLVFHWQKLHDWHTFFQPNSRGFGSVVRAAVTDIQVLSHGFISCGGDGSVKLVQIKNDFAAAHQY